MSDPFIGEIRLLPFTFAPVGWLRCDGSIFSTSQFSALYAVILRAFTPASVPSTQFCVPDLRGSVPMGYNNDASLPLGTKVGTNTVTLTAAQMPAHTHIPRCQTPGTTLVGTPENNVWSMPTPAGPKKIYAQPPDAPNSPMNAPISTVGGVNAVTQAHNNIQPYTAMYYCIAYEGIYPPQPQIVPNI